MRGGAVGRPDAVSDLSARCRRRGTRRCALARSRPTREAAAQSAGSAAAATVRSPPVRTVAGPGPRSTWSAPPHDCPRHHHRASVRRCSDAHPSRPRSPPPSPAPVPFRSDGRATPTRRLRARMGSLHLTRVRQPWLAPGARSASAAGRCRYTRSRFPAAQRRVGPLALTFGLLALASAEACSPLNSAASSCRPQRRPTSHAQAREGALAQRHLDRILALPTR